MEKKEDKSGTASTGEAAAPKKGPEPMVTEAKREFEYDIFVIGGGSGGLALAKEAAELGAKVALADFVKPSPKGTQWGLGGTCVNVGCIPKKLMHYAALCGASFKDQKEAGWELPEKMAHDWTHMQENVARHIYSLNWGYKTQLREKKVRYYNKFASLLDKHTILLQAPGVPDEKASAKYIVIAVGGRPNYEAIPGAKEYAISSDDLFWLTEPPGKTLVVGASYVALECAGFLSHLGFPVTIMVRSIFLRGYDQDMATRVGDYMEKHGVKMIKETVPDSLTKSPSGKVLVKFKDAKTKAVMEEEYDTVLLAIGRKAVTAELKLENAGIKTEPNGKIIVNEKDQTMVDNIFAIGDVIFGKPELTPVAIKAGRLLAQRLLGKGTELMDYVNIASSVYTPLEYGFCGLSEEDAIKTYTKDNVVVYHTYFKPLEWNFLESREDDACYIKIVVEKVSNRVLGFHYLGPNAGEIAQGYAVAIKLGVTKAQWDKTVGIHPTCAEELLSIKDVKGGGAAPKKKGC